MSSNRYAFFRGKIVPLEEAKVGIMTSAFNYGTGIFEGIRGYWNGEEEQLYVFRLREHFARFLRNCQVLLIELPYTLEQLREATLKLLQREEFRTDVYIRPLAYKASEVVGVRLHDLESDCAIFAIPFGEYIKRPDGARVMVSSWRRLDDNAIPPRSKITGAYVNSALAKTEAFLNGFDEALMLCRDGHLAEGSAENLFIVRDGTLITPPVTDNILEGITRATILQFAKDLGIETMERPIDRSELYIADEAFLCGTGAGLVPIVEVDHRSIADGTPGPIFAQLKALYQAAVRGKEPRYRHWCTPVYRAAVPSGTDR
ncbi:MAG: branched-chain amino acid transaminase [Candidatus Bipolaricaulia bacterium]